MENLKQPAYPLPFSIDSRDQHFDTTDYGKGNGGLTKLELASIMMAQGILANSPDWSETEEAIKWVGATSVKYAKAVLEEANK